MAGPLRILIVDSDAESRGAIRSMIAGMPAMVVAGESDSLSEALARAAGLQFDVLFMEDPGDLGVVSQVTQKLPSTAVVVTGMATSSDDVIEIIRAGAFEFLKRPVQRASLTAALDKLVRVKGTSQPRRRGRVTAVYSPKGGLGVTTVAVNIAVALAGQSHGKALLVELDTRQSDVATLLDLRPRFSILDLLEGVDRMDDALLQGLLTRHESGLSVLPAPSRAERAPLGAEPVRLCVEQLASRFEHVVLDLRHDVDPATLAALESADAILYLTTPNVSALRLGAGGVHALRHLGLDTRNVKVVVMRDGTGDEVTLKHVREALGLPVYWRIPSDYRAAIESINSGRPVVSAFPRSRMAQSLRECATALAGEGRGRAAPVEKRATLLGTPWPVKRLLGV